MKFVGAGLACSWCFKVRGGREMRAAIKAAPTNANAKNAPRLSERFCFCGFCGKMQNWVLIFSLQFSIYNEFATDHFSNRMPDFAFCLSD